MKIKSIEYLSVFIIVIISSFLGSGNYSIIKNAGVDSWISIILASIIGVSILLIILFINNKYENLNIRQKIDKVFKTKIKYFVIFLIIIVAILKCSSATYNISNFIVSQFLSETNPLIIEILFLIMVFYIGTKNLNTFTRVSFIILLINTVLFSLAIMGVISSFKLDNLKPIAFNNTDNIILGSLRIVLLNITPAFAILSIPKNKVENLDNKKLIFGYVYACLIILLVTTFTIGSLGINLSKLYQFPEYIVLKRINFFNFIEQIENIIVLQWIFGSFVGVTLFSYLIKCLLNKINSKVTNLVLVILILIISNILFKNNTVFNNYVYFIEPLIKIIPILMLIIISIKLIIKKKN